MRVELVAARSGPDHEWIWAPVFLAGALLLRLAPWLPPPFPLSCPLKTLTGLPCPSCGTTRALEALAALDLGEALRWNPLGAVAGIAAALFTLYAIGALVLRTRRIRITALSLAERLGIVALVLANWAWLVADGR